MVDALKHPLQVWGPQQHLCYVSFTTAGTGAVTVNDSKGVVTAARTGVGVFVATFQNGAKYYVPDVSYSFTTTAQQPLITAFDPVAKTVTVTVVGAGGNTAADTTGMTIFLQCFMRMEN